MFTQCPNCETIFAVRREHLEVRQGLVRCGRCREVFNASWNLIDRLPDAEVAADEARPVDEPGHKWPREPFDAEHPPQESRSPRAPSVPSPPARGGEASLMQALSGLLEPAPHAADPVPQSHADSLTNGESERDDPNRLRQRGEAPPKPHADESSAPQTIEPGVGLPETPPVPSLPPRRRARRRARAEEAQETAAGRDSAPPAGARAARRRRRRRRNEAEAPAARWLDFSGPLAKTTGRMGLVWSLVALLLLAALGWQVRTFYLADLAAVAPLRPLLAGFCRLSGCALPPRQDLGRIELVDTGIVPHPDTPGALRVSASFVNRADFAQRYPLVQVTLTDKIGNIVGRRAYPSREYLMPGRRDLTMLTPNVVEVVSLDLASPHEKAVGYEIELVAAPPS